jgi:hypothetical protein
MLKSKKNHPYAKPFLKWAGGKRGLIEQLFKKFPTEFNNYRIGVVFDHSISVNKFGVYISKIGFFAC